MGSVVVLLTACGGADVEHILVDQGAVCLSSAFDPSAPEAGTLTAGAQVHVQFDAGVCTNTCTCSSRRRTSASCRTGCSAWRSWWRARSTAASAGAASDGRRQARLARLLALDAVEIEPLDELRARAAGQLCGMTRATDVIAATVVLCARARGHRIVTFDPDDLARLDPRIELILV